MEEANCTLCPLHKSGCLNVKMEPEGDGDILILGDFPSAVEDANNRQMVGEAGMLFRKFIEYTQIEPSRFRFSKAVRCNTNNDGKQPTQRQIKACAVNLTEELERYQTKFIVPLGNTALKALREANILRVGGNISTLQGHALPSEDGDIVIFPMFHPAYLMHNQDAMEAYVEKFNLFEKTVIEGVMPVIDTDYSFSDDIADLKTALKEACMSGLVAYDIETNCLSPVDLKDARIICFALSWAERQGFGFWLTKENYNEAIDVLHTQLLENKKVKKIIQHAKFELSWSMHHGRTIWNFADTMLIHWHMNEKNGTHGLGKLAVAYTDMGFYDSALESYKELHKEADPSKTIKNKLTGEVLQGSYANIPPEILLPYNCADTDAAYRIYKVFVQGLSQKQLWILENVQYPACYPLAEMEVKGVQIDWKYLEKLDEDLLAKIADVEERLFKNPIVNAFKDKMESEDREFNFNSPTQLRRLLFSEIGLPNVYDTKSGNESTDKHVLEHLAKKHEVPALILERRKFSTLHTNFVIGAFEKQRGGRLHTKYGMAHTETGRYNSQGPNLQNIPRDKTVKNMFIPDDGCLMVQADFSQVELRVMALFSQDENLLQAFRDGVDVHRMIASRIHERAPETITSEERTAAKRVVFGLCYGQGAWGLSQELGMNIDDAEAFLGKFFQEFPNVQKWIKGTQAKAYKHGQVETIFGRIRRLPDAQIKKRDHPLRTRAMRQAINMPIQGTAADILALKKAEIWHHFKNEGLSTRMILTVHDSLVFSVPPEEINYVIPAAKYLMEDFSKLDWVTIPILADFEIGDRWGEMISLSNSAVEALANGVSLENVLESLE